MVLRELCSYFDSECKLILRYFVDEGVDSERCRVFSIDTIVHDQEFSIWWIDGHGLHCFEITDIHTLVEIAIIKNNTSDLTGC